MSSNPTKNAEAANEAVGAAAKLAGVATPAPNPGAGIDQAAATVAEGHYSRKRHEGNMEAVVKADEAAAEQRDKDKPQTKATELTEEQGFKKDKEGDIKVDWEKAPVSPPKKK